MGMWSINDWNLLHDSKSPEKDNYSYLIDISRKIIGLGLNWYFKAAFRSFEIIDRRVYKVIFWCRLNVQLTSS